MLEASRLTSVGDVPASQELLNAKDGSKEAWTAIIGLARQVWVRLLSEYLFLLRDLGSSVRILMRILKALSGS
jgi:hypothetical protein